MLDNFKMPCFLSNNFIELHARNNHKYDADLWESIQRHRDFLRQYLLWVDQTNSLDDCAAASEMFTEKWAAGTIFAYSIVSKTSGKAVGSIDIHNINMTNRSADIGYWLSADINGRGYMSSAVKLIENEAFSLGLHRLVIAVQKENLRSIRVAEHNNYIYEGTLKQALYKYGSYYDELIYAKVNNT